MDPTYKDKVSNKEKECNNCIKIIQVLPKEVEAVHSKSIKVEDWLHLILLNHLWLSINILMSLICIKSQVLMTIKVNFTEITIDAVEFKMLSCKEQLLQELKIFRLLVSEMIALFKWFKAAFQKSTLNRTVA